MTIKDLAGLTGLPEAEIVCYCRGGLIGRIEKEEMLFDVGDAKKIGLIRRFKQFGMPERDIVSFFALYRKGDKQQAVAILKDFRKRLICGIHDAQKSLDILDCIIYEALNKRGDNI